MRVINTNNSVNNINNNHDNEPQKKHIKNEENLFQMKTENRRRKPRKRKQ